MKGAKSLFAFIFLFWSQPFWGQDLIVDEILLEGNHKTKESVILRELDFTVGDTLDLIDLDDLLNRNKKRLLSTGLFNAITVNIKKWDTNKGHLTILFVLQENWYIYPVPILEFADRDFNVWWKEFRFDLSRVDYGVRIDHFNTTGHKDRLKAKFQRGYTHKYELIYEYPYFAGNWGFGGQVFMSQNKEMPYITRDNTLLFFKHPDERVLLTRIRAGALFTNRPDAYQFHAVRVEFHHNTIDPFVAKELNPNYFLNGVTSNRFFYLEYDYIYDKRVFPTYPEAGYFWNINMKKEGLGIFDDYTNWTITFTGEKYLQWHRDFVLGSRLRLKGNLIRNTLGYANNTAFGFDEKIRGYELYVTDGSDYALLATDIKWRFFDRTFDFGDYMKLTQFKLCQVFAWSRLSLDLGYSNERTYIATNDFTNRLLIGGGPAIDIFLYNNYRLTVEYNFNHLGQSQLYLKGGIYFR